MNINKFMYIFKYNIAKPGSIKAFKEGIKNECLSTSDLSLLNWRKTKRLVEYAYTHVPYYNNLFKKINLHPDDIKEAKDFEKIPILNRSDIIENYDLLFSDEVNKDLMKVSTTGGSTGVPLKIAMSPKENRELPKWRMLNWWGLNPNVNMASLYRGLPIKGIKKIVLNIINWPQHTIRFDATHMTTENIEKFIQNLQRYNPQLIHGYVGAVDAVADYILKHKIVVPSPKTIWLTAAPISKIQEKKITKAFNAPVCDQYGCSELYFISAECQKKEGLHVFEDLIRLEFLDENNENVEIGEYGDVVFTNLEEYGFPLIRYMNGDRGRYLKDRCSCGMSLPLMDKVRGRISDNIILPKGDIISGEYLTTILDDFTNDVKQFQIIQRKDSSIDINIIFSVEKNKNIIIENILNEFKIRVNDQVEIRVNSVDLIVNLKGKLQFIIKES